MTKMYYWYYFRSPKAIRKALLNWSSWTAYKAIFGSMLESDRNSRSRTLRFIRDVFKAWNREWLPKKRAGATVGSEREYDFIVTTSPRKAMGEAPAPTPVGVPSTSTSS
jgi:hypothetical protein